MRTTVTLDPDTAALLRQEVARRRLQQMADEIEADRDADRAKRR